MAAGIDIPSLWSRIERVLHEHAPEVLATLAPGASAAELDSLQQTIGYDLPTDLRISLQLHNGQIDPSRCLHFCGHMTLMSTKDILRDWQMLTELGEGFDRESGCYFPGKVGLNGDWWRRSCIPFADCEGYLTCVDMDPSRGAGVGAIVEHTHDDSMEETDMPSYIDWLGRVVAALEDGRFDREQHGFFRVHPQFAWRRL